MDQIAHGVGLFPSTHIAADRSAPSGAAGRENGRCRPAKQEAEPVRAEPHAERDHGRGGEVDREERDEHSGHHHLGAADAARSRSPAGGERPFSAAVHALAVLLQVPIPGGPELMIILLVLVLLVGIPVVLAGLFLFVRFVGGNGGEDTDVAELEARVDELEAQIAAGRAEDAEDADDTGAPDGR